MSRAWRRFIKYMAREKKSFKQLQQCSHWLHVHGQMECRLHSAEMAQKDALADCLQAQIDQRDALLDQSRLDLEEYIEQMDAAIGLPDEE